MQVNKKMLCVKVIYWCNVFIGNKWLQQQIPACRPVFTATHVSIGFTVIGIIFLAMGIAFTVVTAGVSSCALV